MKAYFQRLYAQQQEPWNYSFRAAELLRHQIVTETVLKLQEAFTPPLSHGERRKHSEGEGRKKEIRVLDIGCSVGQLTSQLFNVSDNIVAMDISEVAVKKARENCSSSHPVTQSPSRPVTQSRHYPVTQFLVGSSLSLPFQNESFEIIVLSDGMWEWKLTNQERQSTLEEVNRLLVKGGKAIFTDYLQPKDFDSFVRVIEKSPLKILEVRYLYDRLWYQFESWFKAVRHWKWVREMLSCLWTARFLKIPAMLFGKYGSRHILVVAEKLGTVPNFLIECQD